MRKMGNPMNKRVLAALLALCLCAGALAACSSSAGQPAPTSPAAAATSAAPATDTPAAETTAAETAAATAPAEVPGTVVPISPTPVTLTAACMQDEANGRPTDEIWFWKYLSKFHNLNFEVEQILTSAIDERKSLMFASNSLPDMLLGLNLTTTEFVKYGQTEGQLLALSDYINDKNTPNIVKLFAGTPGTETAVTLPNGKIYGLPIVGMTYNMGYYNGDCWWYNQNWFKELNLSMPKTVDEMLAALRAVKAAAGKGSIPADVIPLGGSSKAQTPYWLLLNAFGFITCGGDLTSTALVNGEPQVVCYDKERFPAFLQYLCTLYKEGLISQDFFTMDNTQVDGQKANGLYAVSSFLPALMADKAKSGSVADWSDFWAMGTLSSKYNETGAVADVSTTYRFNIGTFAASAKTKEPELIAHFADFWYSDEGTLISAQRFPGFDKENKYSLDMFKVQWNDEVGNTEAVFPDGKINTKDVGQSEYLTPVYPFLCYQDYMGILYKAWGKEYTRPFSDGPAAWDPYRVAANVDRSNMDRWAVTIYDKFMPSTTGVPYPAIVYMDEKSTTRAADIKTLIDDYAAQEVAKFVTGKRALNDAETAGFFADLEKMGIQEYLGYYTDAYKALK